LKILYSSLAVYTVKIYTPWPLAFLIVSIFLLFTQQWFVFVPKAMPLIDRSRLIVGERWGERGLHPWQIATVCELWGEETKHTLDFLISRCAHTEGT
jgi:hypothetical protein